MLLVALGRVYALVLVPRSGGVLGPGPLEDVNAALLARPHAHPLVPLAAMLPQPFDNAEVATAGGSAAGACVPASAVRPQPLQNVKVSFASG